VGDINVQLAIKTKTMTAEGGHTVMQDSCDKHIDSYKQKVRTYQY